MPGRSCEVELALVSAGKGGTRGAMRCGSMTPPIDHAVIPATLLDQTEGSTSVGHQSTASEITWLAPELGPSRRLSDWLVTEAVNTATQGV
jgi:hypothetical protein